jgi:hypothetical protein
VVARVLRNLHEKDLLSDERRRMLLGWRHSGFSVFAGRAIAPCDTARLERLARYVRRPHVAAAKVVYDEGADRVIFRSQGGIHPGFKANFRIFWAQDFVAEVCGFIPMTFQHETIAYGEYANVVRGRRKRAAGSGEIAVVDPDARRIRKAWRHLIKHIYEVDPLTCPRCGEEMRIVSIIDQQPVIERILRHLGMWPPPTRPPKPRIPRPGPASHPRPRSRRSPRPPTDHEHSQRTPWNEEDLSQAPPGWDDQVPA